MWIPSGVIKCVSWLENPWTKWRFTATKIIMGFDYHFHVWLPEGGLLCEPNVLQNPHVVFGSFPLLLEIVFSCVPRFVWALIFLFCLTENGVALNPFITFIINIYKMIVYLPNLIQSTFGNTPSRYALYLVCKQFKMPASCTSKHTSVQTQIRTNPNQTNIIPTCVFAHRPM